MRNIVEKYNDLVDKALTIVDGPPHWQDTNDAASAKIDFDDETVTLSLPRAASDWDSCIIEINAVKFPIGLMEMDNEELAAWKASEKRKYEEGQRKINEAAERAREAEELRMLASLKLKYETR